jgi:hypothetical protein
VLDKLERRGLIDALQVAQALVASVGCQSVLGEIVGVEEKKTISGPRCTAQMARCLNRSLP